LSRLTLAFGLALLALETALAVWITATSEQVGTDSFAIAIPAGVVFVISGLVALLRRPENRTGLYLAAVGYIWLLGALADSGDSWLFTLGLLIAGLVWVPFGALVLSYPTGRLETRLERALPVTAGIVLTGTTLIEVLFDVTPAPDRCEACPESALFVTDRPELVTAARILAAVASLALIVVVIGILTRRWQRATPALRRLLSPVLGAASATLVAAGLFVIADQVSDVAAEDLLVLFYVVFTTVPLAFLFGILRTRLARSSVAEVVMALESGVPLRDALATALGDPTVEIAFRLDPRDVVDGTGWVDPQGRSVPGPVESPGRAVRFVDRNGARVAALTCDASLLHEPELVDAVMAAAGLAISNERLQAELRAEIRLADMLTGTSPALLTTVDTQGRLLTANPAAVAASGHDDASEVLGRFFWEIFIAEVEREEMVARFAAAAPDFPLSEYENAFTNARGEDRVIYWRSAPVLGEDGTVVRLVAGGLDITERKRREEEARAGAERLRAVIEGAPVAIVEVDNRQRVQGWNPAAERIFGWKAEDVIGARTPLIPPEREHEFREIIDEGIGGGARTGYETKRLRSDGTLVDVELSTAPIRNADGTVVGQMAVLSDITERNRLEEEKERERVFLNAIANTAPSILCLIDDHGVVQDRATNLAFERTLGYETDDTGGHVFWERYVAPEHAAEVRDLVERVVGGETLPEHDHRWTTHDGRELLIAWTCTPLPRIDERRLLLISGVDVTERMEREIEVGRQRDLLRAITEAASSFLVTVNPNGVVVPQNNNRAFLTTFGWSEEEIVGRSFLGLVGREDDYIARMAIANAANGIPQPERESVWLDRDGEERTVAWTARHVLDPGGQSLTLVSGTDVTVRRRQEEELRASRARILEAEDQARRKLERNLHDGAQQRLVALSISLRLAESKLGGGDPCAAASVLASAREELMQALEELRELARGIHPAVLTDRGLEPALEAVATRAPIPVELDVAGEHLPKAVEAAIYFVVAESLTNVAKYAQATSASVTVERENGTVVVEVSDDGLGGADPAGGTGLRGLADRVAALDGVLLVESSPGNGTTIRAEIPLVRVEARTASLPRDQAGTLVDS
jgi:PAS domain S-box-containing protein